MATEEIPSKRKIAFEEEPDEEEPEEDEYYEDETDEDEDEDEDEDGIVDLLANTLATPEGDTLCGTLVQISNTLETQNKILIKLLSTLSKR
tara:strand:+ start:626 stop:898 length:273 start_codon:yes stop_codon:yes gene_type:complete